MLNVIEINLFMMKAMINRNDESNDKPKPRTLLSFLVLHFNNKSPQSAKFNRALKKTKWSHFCEFQLDSPDRV